MPILSRNVLLENKIYYSLHKNKNMYVEKKNRIPFPSNIYIFVQIRYERYFAILYMYTQLYDFFIIAF
jgi:hypothetical protein